MGSRAAECARRVLCTMLPMVTALVTGCAAAGAPAPVPASSRTPTSFAAAAGGVSLAQLGFRHGPSDLVTVPAGVRLAWQIDQPTVVTAGFVVPTGQEISEWLRAELPSAGFTVTAGEPDAVLFRGHGWSGAFTAGGGESALTLRRLR